MTIPHVVGADYEGEYRIRLTFDEGTTATVDFRPWLRGPIFEPLKEPSYFKRFFLDGGTVAWPNGADVAPETLHAAARRAHLAGAGPRVSAPRNTPKRSRISVTKRT